MEHKIETERLLLRPLIKSDIAFMQALMERQESYQYETETPKPKAEIKKQCRWYMKRAFALPDEGAIRWVVIHDGVRIGEVHVTCNWEQTLEWEIGWYFLAEYWGKGFATEASKAVIAYAFAHFKVNRLAAFINAGNKRSAALAGRAGMVLEGRLRETRLVQGAYCDEYVFSLLKRDYIQD